MKEKYYVGIDAGIGSVGMAATDANYNPLKINEKTAMFVRTFPEAETSEKRRLSRTSRRTLNREKRLIDLLNSYFEKEINKIDPNFLIRLKNSKYHLEDKDLPEKYSIFSDKNYTDKNYFAEYPTIFHLKSELIHNPAPHDIRLIYLAILHFFKNRGHFLSEGFDPDNIGENINEVYENFVNILAETREVNFPINIDIVSLREILSDRSLKRKECLQKVLNFLSISSKDKERCPYVKLMCGMEVKIKALFNDIIIDESTDKGPSINLRELTDEKKEKLYPLLNEMQWLIIDSLKEFYDGCTLYNIMKGFSYLSDARMASYDKHHYDLICLKEAYKTHKPEKYNAMFRDISAWSYSSYVGSTHHYVPEEDKMVTKRRVSGTASKSKKEKGKKKEKETEDIFSVIKKDFENIPSKDANIIYILDEIEKNAFLPKQKICTNSIIPNQLYLKELKMILRNAEQYYPFLKETDEYGLTISERIEQLFTGHIPYYVGPTTENSQLYGGNGWVKRKEGEETGPVYPWNMEQKIDLVKTSEQFILQKIRHCTYFKDELVLPKNSLMYQKYCVLNEINNIRIHNQKITVEQKQALFDNVFKKGKNVTKKQVANFFIKMGILDDPVYLSGIGEKVGSCLSTYGQFKEIFGDDIEHKDYQEMIEQIVQWSTIHGDNKSLLKKQIMEHYTGIITEEQISKILSLKFKDWGRFSKEFLNLPGFNKKTEQKITLLQGLWENNLNLMEIFNSNEYTYKEEFEKRKNEVERLLNDWTYEDLDEYYFPAPVKRMIWQTLSMLKEFIKVMGYPPERIFIESTRYDGDIEKIKSRKEKLLKLYKNDKEWKAKIEEYAHKLKSRRVYLYFLQKGRCMYTGDEINLNSLIDDLSKNLLYDLDHIQPYSLTKDNNLENNLVLVYKSINSLKQNIYPLNAYDPSIQKKQASFWKYLLDHKFITEEKYRRLVRTTPLTDEELTKFIARQLVETSQGCKGIADILKKALPDTKIIYTKAKNISEFRHDFKLPKCRSVNDFHHAHDAYLSIIVGNAYYTKFTLNPANFIEKEFKKDKVKYHYNLGRMFKRNIERNGETAWIAEKEEDDGTGTIKIVRNVLSKNNITCTRMVTKGHGSLFKLTRMSHELIKEKGYIPLKYSDHKLHDITKYGGYTSLSIAYSFFVEHDKKKKRIITLESVPLIHENKIKRYPNGLIDYCINDLKLINPTIKRSNIKAGTLIKVNNYPLYLAGKTDNKYYVINAANLCITSDWMIYIKHVEKVAEEWNKNKNPEKFNCYHEQFISHEKNLELYVELLEKHKNDFYSNRPNSVVNKLETAYKKFKSLDIKDQCCVLIQILILTKRGGNGQANLSLIGLSERIGTMKINKNISSYHDFKIIDQSFTGLFEK